MTPAGDAIDGSRPNSEMRCHAVSAKEDKGKKLFYTMCIINKTKHFM